MLKLLFLSAITCCINFRFGFSCSIGKDRNDYTRIDDMKFRKNVGRAGEVDMAWPDGVIIYKIDKSIDESKGVRKVIEESMKALSTSTCIKFRTATKTDTYWLKYWVDPAEMDCSSFIGWQNRRDQPINLSPDCTKGNVIHETMHALGFLHEHTRNDRDEYITVIYENIIQRPYNYTSNYMKDSETGHPRTSYYGVPYNYESIMHYGPIGFSISDDIPTIVSKHNRKGIGNDKNMGQRDKLTDGDIKLIKTKYNCPA